MASDVEICNRALQKVGAKRISSLTENSVSARACNAAYEPVKKALLEKHEWGFSIKRDALAADASAPSWGRENAFQVPADFIRLCHNYPEDVVNTDDLIVEGQKIYTDLDAPLYIRYVSDITDPNEMHPLFRELFATELALELCEQLTQSNTKKESLKDDQERIIKEAKRSNAIQKPAQTPPEDSWVTCRS